MRHTYSKTSGAARTVLRLAALIAVGLPAATADAQAYKYDVGPNTVNMPGSACRTERFDYEATDVYHDSGATSVRWGRGPRRLFCPIPRRGTGYYAKAGWPAKVNMSRITLGGSDNSTAHGFVCSSFITDMNSQATTWGAPRYLCSTSSTGCSSVSASYTGANTMRVAPPVNGSAISSVNFGIVCDAGPASSVIHYEVLVTPNG
jgi:hypothetical protein